ncbi:hypothetical protein Cni_G16804 [Canna indica]|uniref:Uncharacterized protein n=1 Tax=Canna indica TaxID=4628 RepID=A0AAQ3KG40_9LILI|nr:hypothetical protein Cni_G16804 [Canna indica]
MANHLRALVGLFLLTTFLSMVGIAFASSNLVVQGRVYCDTCRAGFETSATEYMEGAKVKLQCRNYTNGAITVTEEGVTDESGTYKIEVSDDHQEETCAVMLLKSSRKDCSEVSEDRNHAPVILTHNVGIASNVRNANSLGFLKDEPLPSCGQLLMQYALGVDD